MCIAFRGANSQRIFIYSHQFELVHSVNVQKHAPKDREWKKRHARKKKNQHQNALDSNPPLVVWIVQDNAECILVSNSNGASHILYTFYFIVWQKKWQVATTTKIAEVMATVISTPAISDETKYLATVPLECDRVQSVLFQLKIIFLFGRWLLFFLVSFSYFCAARLPVCLFVWVPFSLEPHILCYIAAENWLYKWLGLEFVVNSCFQC